MSDIGQSKYLAGLPITVVDGKPMIDAELVEGAIFQRERALERLANAIKRERYAIFHETTTDNFVLTREQ